MRDTIEMAREAGYHTGVAKHDLELLKAFADLVRADEREEFAVHAVDIARRAIAEEREACAKVCEQSAQNYYPAIPEASGACIHLAIAIRTRGQA